MEMNISPSYDSFNLPYQASKSSTFFHEAMANEPYIPQLSGFVIILYLWINGKRHRAWSMGQKGKARRLGLEVRGSKSDDRGRSV
jgi:hypothetical protein